MQMITMCICTAIHSSTREPVWQIQNLHEYYIPLATTDLKIKA